MNNRIIKFGDFVKDEEGTVLRVIYAPPTPMFASMFALISVDTKVYWCKIKSLTPLPDYVDFDGPPKPKSELDSLLKLRVKLVEGYEHAKACEDAMLKPTKPATLQIEAGKYYRTQSGRIVGPATSVKNHSFYSWIIDSSWYANDGRYWADEISINDLVAEVPLPVEPEPVYVPWTFTTMPIAVKVRVKLSPDRKHLTMPWNEVSVRIGAGTFFYASLFDNYEQLDGSPCGELKCLEV